MIGSAIESIMLLKVNCFIKEKYIYELPKLQVKGHPLRELPSRPLVGTSHSMPGSQVRSLVGELGSHEPRGAAKKKGGGDIL